MPSTEEVLRRYQLLLDNLAAAILIRDGQHKISFCSPYTEILTGYSLSEIYAEPEDFFLRIIHPEDLERYRRARGIAEMGEAFQVSFRFFHKSGIEMWAESRTVPVLSENANVELYFSAVLDVTANQRFKRLVEERNRDLRDFSYMISHDLKAPIYTIKGMLGVIQPEEKNALSAESQEALLHIERAAERMERLVASVIEYSKISAQENQDKQVNLNTVLEEVLDEYKANFQAIGAKLTLPGALPIVLGDETKLYQVFSNLYSNAIKYRHPDRPLELELRVLESVIPRQLLLELRDNGRGVSSEMLPHIFRPFRRAHKDVADGTGIGLASVAKLLDKIGGSISVTSQENQATCFKIQLRSVG